MSWHIRTATIRHRMRRSKERWLDTLDSLRCRIRGIRDGFFLFQEEREMARKLGQSWRMGWTEADQKIAEECAFHGC